MISRLVEQKGFGLLKQVAEKLFKEDVQLVVLGEGDKEIEEWLETTAKKYPQRWVSKLVLTKIYRTLWKLVLICI